jgi:pyruvyltransferase
MEARIMQTIKTFYHKSENFGDAITPYLLSKMGYQAEYVDKGSPEEHYIICGSILPACNEHSIIWGAGVAQEHNDITWIRPKKIYAVRGKHTRDLAIRKGFDCPEVYGDPVQLLPYFYNPKIEKTRKTAMVPHMVERHLYNEIIDITQPIERFIDAILQCEEIHSSSLHALVAAEAYGIKWKWIDSPNVIGNGLKFRDWMETEYDIKKFIEACPLSINIK